MKINRNLWEKIKILVGFFFSVGMPTKTIIVIINAFHRTTNIMKVNIIMVGIAYTYNKICILLITAMIETMTG